MFPILRTTVRILIAETMYSLVQAVIGARSWLPFHLHAVKVDWIQLPQAEWIVKVRSKYVIVIDIVIDETESRKRCFQF